MVQPSANVYENLFHASTLELLVPEVSALPPAPSEKDSSSVTEKWWAGAQVAEARDVAFLDEKISYYVALSLPDSALADLPSTSSTTDPPGELVRFLSQIQLSITASLLPPLQRPQPPTSSARSDPQTTSTSLAPSNTLDPSTPRPASMRTGHPEDSLLPITPNPFPVMKEAEADYAAVEGVLAWEGKVGMQSGLEGRDGSRRIVRRREGDGWDIIWQGEVPIAYVRTSIQNPLLGLTASMTLRDNAVARHSHIKGFSIDSMVSEVGAEPPELPGKGETAGDALAGMQEMDLLGGLDSVAKVPASRLPTSLQQDLSLPSISTGPPVSAFSPPSSTPSTYQAVFPAQPPSTLRKSYRRVLSLSSGLRVRMRTLFLPQLPLPPQGSDLDTGGAGQPDTESERKVVLVVEVENPLDSTFASAFEVESVKIDIAGKGSPVSASLVKISATGDSTPFPIRLEAVEQYNLLYVVDIVSPDQTDRFSAPEQQSAGIQAEQRPVVIIVTGRPYISNLDGKDRYPTHSFQSRWNCSLDLTPFHASLAASSTVSPLHNGTSQRPVLGRQSKAGEVPNASSQANAIVGDKRYSLASLASHASGSSGPSDQARNRYSSGTQKPLPPGPAQGVRGVSKSGPGQNPTDHGLLISVRVLPSHSGHSVEPISARIRPLEPFSIEVFVQNRTEEVRRFRLSVPGRADWVERVRAVWSQRRPRKSDEPFWGVDDSVLRQSLATHIADSPGLVPLENDIRCGPLLPGASMSARIKFLALREGLHTIEQLRVSGVGDNYESIMSPVLQVLVDG